MMDRVFFHIDVNSAFLSWDAIERLKAGEELDIRTIPAIVGGDPTTRRGIVLSKSHPCKPYKILTGESLGSALKKCPFLTIIPGRFDLYQKHSNDLITFLGNFSDRIQQYSIDEAFIDYTHMEEHYGPPLVAADMIRNEIRQRFGFTVSIGVGPNKLLAKMATKLRKPDFTNSLFLHELEKMWVLPIEELFMAGRATAPKLRNIGIDTIGDLAKYDLKHLSPQIKSSVNAYMLWQYANGIDDSEISKNQSAAKSIGNSTTISYDVTSIEAASKELLLLCESVGKNLRENNYQTSVISIGVRNSSFDYYSCQEKFSIPTDSTQELHKHVMRIFKKGWRRDPIRQLGVRAEKLTDSRFTQISLLDNGETDRVKRLDSAIDDIRRRFGNESVMRACFLSENPGQDLSLDKFSPFLATGRL